MTRPRILLAGKMNMHHYVDAVEQSGGVAEAMYLPPLDTSYDGLILCGGCDIDPKYYHADMDGSVDIDEARDKAEFALLKAYVEAGKPVMGICRGYQMINVYFGGTMLQDIPETPVHRSGTDHYASHLVTADPNSIVGRLHGTEFAVNSAHHQAIDRLGKDLRATAFWQDRYVEAIEHVSLPVFGVQWHPERMCYLQRRNDTTDGKEMFLYFVGMCRKENEHE